MDLDRSIARLLSTGTYIAVTCLAVGVGLMVVQGVGPLSPGGPAFDPLRLPADIAALRPEGFLWLGLLAVIATPTGRVVASLAGYLLRSERAMAAVAVAILGVIAVSIVLGGAGA